MFLPLLILVIMAGCAVFFYRAADYEDLRAPILWGAGSALLFIASVWGLGLGLFGVLGVQALLFVGMGVAIYFTKWR